ncbi:unnamed protein product [Tuber aestivum]|uniref:Core Histone H2A/H2B/H3 domain-containing protein n=1 Tax=Tuber aestivum TaxID=59557 RepID=A0A292PQT6_9PEZI|nr:unnamed protein product [Tuber aestivum]
MSKPIGLGGKGGGNWGPPTSNLGRKKAGPVVDGVKKAARYPPGRVADAEIIKYQKDGGYLIPKAPFNRLCREIVSDLPLDQRLRLQGSAIEAAQAATEEYMVLIMAAAGLGAAHASRATVQASDITLVVNILRVMAGEADKQNTEQEGEAEEDDDGGEGPWGDSGEDEEE